eukprot:7287863-Pyramimonas_sp.AAC.1
MSSPRCPELIARYIASASTSWATPAPCRYSAQKSPRRPRVRRPPIYYFSLRRGNSIFHSAELRARGGPAALRSVGRAILGHLGLPFGCRIHSRRESFISARGHPPSRNSGQNAIRRVL